jgi:sulfite oxidase
VRSAWNWDLHVTSSAHRIKLYSVNKTRAGTRARLQAGLPFEPITLPPAMSLEDPDEYLAEYRKLPREPVA